VIAVLQEHAPAAADAAAEHAAATPFTINGGLIIWTLVVFGLLMFILARTAWPAILKQIDAADKANAEAQKILADYQAQVANAHAEAQEFVAQGRMAGEKLREELAAKGRQEQEELLERARREIALERDRALTELRREAVDLSLAAASKVIGRNLDSEADRRLVQDYLASIQTKQS
jgi:F-type H+-transporting ATPase subunit b